ncbi:hypothetical protein BGZ46_006846 [Entomortierella lignicola]|nr:hypothetical protein BGZ46_006846 [Entomortierella lignicola]
MSSILNVIRSAPTPTRHFTSLHIIASSRSQSAGFNPEHHPIVLQQLVESLSPTSFVAPSSEVTSNAAKESLSGKDLASQASQPSAGSQAKH